MDLKQTVQVDKDLQIRAYYAGHVRFLDLTSTAFPTLTAMFPQLMMNIFLFNPLHCQVSPHAGFVIILILRFCCLYDVKNISLALFSGHVTPLATAYNLRFGYICCLQVDALFTVIVMSRIA